MNISELQHNSYTPYSNKSYAPAAVVKSKQGGWFPGVRIENISFPLTISPVQNALFCCLSEGHQPYELFVEEKQQSDPFVQYWVTVKNLNLQKLNTLDDIPFYSVLRSIDQRKIVSTLQNLLEHSQAEHSKFPVSALVETDRGFITGINIETEDWGKGLCAERVALAKTITYGVSDIKALHICTLRGEYNSPCGACRQVIIEHMPHHAVYLYHSDGTEAMHFTSDLLPYSFQSSTLRKEPNP